MDSLAISSRTPSNVIDGRLHPVANPTSTGWLDFRTSVSKFVSVTSTVDFIRQDKGSAHTPATARVEDFLLPPERRFLISLSRYACLSSSRGENSWTRASLTRISILPKLVRWKGYVCMKLWVWDEKNIPSITHGIRTAVATTASVMIARLVQMPEAYWAAIATLVVMQSTLGATLTLSVERIVATAVGASVGAVEANYFGSNLAAFMLSIFFIGLLSFGFRLERTAYRYASVTLAIIVLIPRTNPAWIVALHRFIEVSVGIIMALAVVAFWPERSAIPAKNAAE